MKLRILDKYIFTEIFKTFMFAVCAFTAVFVGSGTLFRIAQYITEYGAPIASVVKIFVLSLPGVIVWTFPMSMLLAGLMTSGRLSSSSEITAMKSCGISFYRIAAPAIFMGILVSVFSINFNEYVVPWSNEAYTRVLEYEIKGNVIPKSQDHIVIKQVENGVIKRLVYAQHFDEETSTMNFITLQNYDDNGVLQQVEKAEKAVWENDQWSMQNGVIYDISQESSDDNNNKSGIGHSMVFNTQILPINSNPKEISREQKSAEEMSMEELQQQIELLQSQFVNTKKLEIELYQRVTIPVASLVFVLISVPLGMQNTRRSNSSAGFAMSIVIIFVYYGLMTLAGALGQGGVIHPALACWIPNIVGLLVGAYLMWRAAR